MAISVHTLPRAITNELSDLLATSRLLPSPYNYIKPETAISAAMLAKSKFADNIRGAAFNALIQDYEIQYPQDNTKSEDPWSYTTSDIKTLNINASSLSTSQKKLQQGNQLNTQLSTIYKNYSYAQTQNRKLNINYNGTETSGIYNTSDYQDFNTEKDEWITTEISLYDKNGKLISSDPPNSQSIKANEVKTINKTIETDRNYSDSKLPGNYSIQYQIKSQTIEDDNTTGTAKNYNENYSFTGKTDINDKVNAETVESGTLDFNNEHIDLGRPDVSANLLSLNKKGTIDKTTSKNGVFAGEAKTDYTTSSNVFTMQHIANDLINYSITGDSKDQREINELIGQAITRNTEITDESNISGNVVIHPSNFTGTEPLTIQIIEGDPVYTPANAKVTEGIIGEYSFYSGKLDFNFTINRDKVTNELTNSVISPEDIISGSAQKEKQDVNFSGQIVSSVSSNNTIAYNLKATVSDDISDAKVTMGSSGQIESRQVDKSHQTFDLRARFVTSPYNNSNSLEYLNVARKADWKTSTNQIYLGNPIDSILGQGVISGISIDKSGAFDIKIGNYTFIFKNKESLI